MLPAYSNNSNRGRTHKEQPVSVVEGREGDRVSNRARIDCRCYLHIPECNEEDVRGEDK